MNGTSAPPPYPSQTPPRRSGGGGCFLKGCLLLVVIVMLLGVFFGGSAWYFWHATEPFRTSARVPIPTFPDDAAAEAATAQKLAAFNQTLAAGQRATLSLTGDDLNVLLAHDPELSRYRDRVFLSVVHNQLVVETSFPLVDDSSLPAAQRLFFNARFVLDASYSSGDFAFLLARLESINHRQPAPVLLNVAKWYVSNGSQTFNRAFHEQPEKFGDLPPFTAQIHTIIIQDNQLVATSVDHPKPVAVPTPSPDPSPAAAPVAASAEPR